ncbi:RNA polymerase sigma-70 factor (sigma-E family) [Saccharothrix tamanrassetensis]|uniref:RNA polymerase sigma-70 factor (Sigma-E family) n=1 Tax=Saccharothrix tamanrassetensis TaxID=1051531 RepID=A0A841CRY8_9PSEU|nr:SigE family RNA polymerase sigma factor [Saccharothrix tamanrassetensis]MBB5958797.1 RNA polymerase sigma-70 factor (sigma-E family) [Saccharothrix tamanrassetensis]
MDDTASFDQFVHEHQQALVRYAVLLSGSRADAEDLVQEVLVRIYQRWGELAGSTASPYAYVRRAVTNEYLSWRRRWSTRHIRTVPELPEGEHFDRHRDQPDERLWRLLRELPRQQRAAVVLRYYEDLTDAEIAEVLSCRLPTVRSHVSRGLAALRSAIGVPERAWRGHD